MTTGPPPNNIEVEQSRHWPDSQEATRSHIVRPAGPTPFDLCSLLRSARRSVGRSSLAVVVVSRSVGVGVVVGAVAMCSG